MEIALQWAAVASQATANIGLTLACGLLLTDAWLQQRGVDAAIGLPDIAWPVSALAVALGARFYLLTATMIQDARPAATLAGARDVAATHAGAVMLWALGAACTLLAASLLLRGRRALDRTVLAALLAAILVLHAAMGHAAGSGHAVREEFWQLAHLTSMSAWAGAVIVGGFLAAPRLLATAGGIDRGYLRALSLTSTWAVLVIVLSGAMRAWTELDARLGNLLASGWGRILLAKLVLVGAAMALGFTHRLAIHRRGEWTREHLARFVATLRTEAVCLLAVLVLSAWLGSADLPGQ